MKYFFVLLFLIAQDSYAQCKTYRLTSNRDTTNCTDFNNNKQGKWIVRVEELRGEPGFKTGSQDSPKHGDEKAEDRRCAP